MYSLRYLGIYFFSFFWCVSSDSYMIPEMTQHSRNIDCVCHCVLTGFQSHLWETRDSIWCHQPTDQSASLRWEHLSVAPLEWRRWWAGQGGYTGQDSWKKGGREGGKGEREMGRERERGRVEMMNKSGSKKKKNYWTFQEVEPNKV